MHAVITTCALPLFVGALLSDWAYASSYQLQWLNFSSWLIAGALPFVGIALLWGGIDVLRTRRAGDRRGSIYWFLLLATFVLGFLNALIHAKDGWATMPAGLIMSVVVALLATLASGVGIAAFLRRAA